MKDDHIADAGKMVPTEWVTTATNAYWLDVGGNTESGITAAIAAIAPLIAAQERERCYEIAPTLVEIERAICCPSGTCTSPNNCYTEDHTRSYPVQIQDAAKAVAKLYRGD